MIPAKSDCKMRRFVDRPKLEEFMKRIGALSKSPGVIYFTGGSTALLLGIREQTIDIDVKLDPEPQGAFQAIAELKESLGVNVELAAPDQFIPPLPGWRERSVPIMTTGKVEFRHYDFYSQALSKIERGYDQDLSDARSLVVKGLVDPVQLSLLFDQIRPDLIKYPALDPADLELKVSRFLRIQTDDSEK